MAGKIPSASVSGDSLFKGHPVYGRKYLPASAMALDPTSAPAFEVLLTGAYAAAFTGTTTTTEEVLHGSIMVPGDFKPDSLYTPELRLIWSHSEASPTGNVRWEVDHTVARYDSKEIFPAITQSTSVQDTGIQYDCTRTPEGDHPIVGDLEPGAIIIIRIERDADHASDTFEADASLIGLEFVYELGQFGTRERNPPYSLDFPA
jgi:hypothetical protein